MQKLSFANGFQTGADKKALTGPPLFVMHWNIINAIADAQSNRLKLSKTVFSVLVVKLRLRIINPKVATQYMYPTSTCFDDILNCSAFVKYFE